MIEIKPQPKQEEFLSSPYDIVIYGGSAGGGKTWSLLLDPIRHIHLKDWRGGLFRGSYAEMKKPGSVWDESFDFYPYLGGSPSLTDKTWNFPSGAVLDFSYINNQNLMDYKGAQYANLYFDQLEEFEEQHFFYMMGRNRTKCGIKPYIRGTANPQPGWLAKFLDWWIAEDGYANLTRAGIPRYFVRISDDLHWGDSPEELLEKYPDVLPKSVTFIPATIFDNPKLMDVDPSYLSNLMALPLVDRERLLGDKERGGNWKIVPAAGLVYNRAWYELVYNTPQGGTECLAWDLAATEMKPGKKPSKTAGVLIRKVKGEYYIKDVYADYLSPAEVERTFVNISTQKAKQAALEGVEFMVRWEEEPGSASKRESRRLAQLLDGIDALGRRATGGDKFVRGRGFASASEVGLVKVVNGNFAETWLNHMHNQPEIDENDIHDATVIGFNELSTYGGAVKKQARSFQG